MFGYGGKYHWRKRNNNNNNGGGGSEAIVVVFAWMSSEERNLKNHVDLYSSLLWDSLVCHSQFLNMFLPDKAADLASNLVSELVKELKAKPLPLVFASFSGGPNACMYKVLQILEGTCETELNPDDCSLVRNCISGFIYDSSPVDFTSDLGARLAVHPSTLGMSKPPKPFVWAANGIASSLDYVFLNRFESQRAEFWQTLYSTITMRVPYLILCSENDDLAPYQTIHNFATRLQELGGNVKLVKWNDSPHVGHYRYNQVDYKAAVSEFWTKARSVYLQKTRCFDREALKETQCDDEISEPVQSLGKSTSGLNRSFNGTPLVTTDHFFVPSTVGYYVGNGGSVQDEHKQDLIRLSSSQNDDEAVKPNGVLGQILFDVYIPKNVEDWDIKLSETGRFKQKPGKRFIRRSRL
ncbi:hypothetical protein EUTSA_v10003219mg [Eutrema salsugineum]|uniref:DUF829 domain-containing protein n=1 Tax=Eutrema salsugineum TaxID=72664 RepID=V4NES7_EUTSA|nr:uncharacterized protein LOC18020666 [Eutrema salsugineum]ESQ44576.1 hypothetical protein EUTSA_v10003219mg [Eutrema salsugineum]